MTTNEHVRRTMRLHKIPEIRRGQYLLIRTDRSMEAFSHPSIASIQKSIDCGCIETISLTKNDYGATEIVMLIDDSGTLYDRDINPIATALYRAVRRAGVDANIHGPAVLAMDEDFA